MALAFRWSYVLIPLLIFVLAMILTAYFYQQLPGDVAYRFKSNGAPNRWLERDTIILWLLVPQFFLTLLAGAITWGITKLATLFRSPESVRIKPEGILRLMGNMVALPQSLLFFAMLDIFSYNAYQVHILPLWALALIIMGVGSIILGLFFIRAIRDIQGTTR